MQGFTRELQEYRMFVFAASATVQGGSHYGRRAVRTWLRWPSNREDRRRSEVFTKNGLTQNLWVLSEESNHGWALMSADMGGLLWALWYTKK